MGLRKIFLLCTLPFALGASVGIGAAQAGDCPGNANALGTSRTLVVDPHEHNRIGTMSYAETLPLADHEVVLTFDDGPIPPYTNRILSILASECVLANYFIVGEMAKAYPDAVRRVYDAGHTIGTHSWSHPIHFRSQTFERAKAQIDGGIDATAAALGDPGKVAPFFRFPGFGFTIPAEEYAASRGLMVWGADVPADDWTNIGPKEVAARAIRRLEAKGRGILLLHDIHERTVEALPIILRELKARGFRVVHVVPSSADRPATVTAAAEWRLKGDSKPEVPVILMASIQDIDGDAVVRKTAAQLCSINPPRHEMFKIGLRKRVHATQIAQHAGQRVAQHDVVKPVTLDIHGVQ
jgi:peptidoglycan/xylan/chitin deacetylase (PgdA/CDA1 family)